MLRLLERRRTDDEARVVRAADGTALARLPEEIERQLQYLWVRVRLHSDPVPSSFLITSKLSGEGVTLVSLALATMAANNGRVLLLEANDTGSRLPVDDTNVGLMGVLTGAATIEETVVETDHAGLSILPIGPASGSGRLGNEVDLDLATGLIGELSARYDTVVVDAPALARSPLALNLAAACAASLLVVRHGVTDLDQVESARADLADANLIGLVLNGTRLATPARIRRLLGNDR